MTSEDMNIIRQAVYEILKASLAKDYGIFCDLHDPKLFDAKDEKAHNCMGCNLNEYSMILVNSFKKEAEYQSEYELFSRFVINAYVLNERVRVYLKLLGIDGEDFNKAYPTSRDLMKWANFIKHPKAFMLVHAPKYVFDGSAEHTEKVASKKYTIIDQAFIDKYYAGPSNNKELFDTLTNQRDVVVVFPVLPKLAFNYADECVKFIQSILSTESYRKVLKDQTTLEKYFSAQEKDDSI